MKRTLLYALTSSIIYLLVLSVAVVYFSRGLPGLERLERIHEETKLTTRIYSSDGVVLKEFAVEKREPVFYEQLPQNLVDAVVSIEDERFWDHWGISLRDIARAVWINLTLAQIKQGASTLTQQLARRLFLTPEKTLARKIKEAITSVRIERTYTKKEIVQMYLNEQYFGNGCYGVQSASGFYFAKDVQDLSLEECAYLAGLLQRPSDYSDSRKDGLIRRNTVLRAMSSAGKISRQETKEAQRAPLRFNDPQEDEGLAPYFTEHVRQHLEAKYGYSAIYESGLSVYTALDSRLQSIAERAVSKKFGQIQWKIDSESAKFPPDSTLFQIGDSLQVNVVQGALVALNIATGEILAMVGGRDFEESEYNRAVQAKRQPGSAFKPFIYTAAIDNHYRTTDKILDNPITLPLNNGKMWSPQNYDRTFKGEMSLREGLKQSRNLVAVKLLLKIGAKLPIQYARKMGIKTPLQPVDALALGTEEVTLLDITSAYGVFPNQGIRVEPISILRILDKDGETIFEEDRGSESEALSAETASVMTSMLKSVMEEKGTGYAARAYPYRFKRPAGGKTGTTQDFTDAWFIGFTPHIVTGVWIGFDVKRSLGDRMAASVVALPPWAEFMKEAHEVLELQENDFQMSPDVVRIQICGDTYDVATDYCPTKIEEVFIPQSFPTELCQEHQVAGIDGISRSRGRRANVF